MLYLFHKKQMPYSAVPIPLPEQQLLISVVWGAAHWCDLLIHHQMEEVLKKPDTGQLEKKKF